MTTLPATRHKPISQLTEAEQRAELAQWNLLERSGDLAKLKPVERKPAAPTRKAVDCGRRDAHPTPLGARELTDVEHEAEALGLATIASELKLVVGVNWFSRSDRARINGKLVEGFTCPCTPDRIWVQAGMQFWETVDSIVHEGRHLDQTERGVTRSREEREADARAWAAKTVAWLRQEGF
jgi:hypothetical protein